MTTKGTTTSSTETKNVHGDYEHNGADPDVWALMFRLKEILKDSFRLTWQRSPPKRRKARIAFHRHNIGNMWSDELADRAMEALEASEQRPYLGDAMSWGVAWMGELLTKDIRRSIRQSLKAESLVHHLRDNRG